MKKMNLKYYLRGLGAGIVVTAIIMSIATDGQKEKLSDAEIKARAAELGMVEKSSGLLSELEKETKAPETAEKTEEPEILEEEPIPEPTEVPEEDEAPKPTETAEVTEISGATESPKVTETQDATESPEVAETPKPTQKPQVAEAPSKEPAADIITIEIKAGEGSYTVCKRLEEEGLIASAADFDTYLCDRGLDKRLRAGSYEIPKDAEPEEIAKILSS